MASSSRALFSTEVLFYGDTFISSYISRLPWECFKPNNLSLRVEFKEIFTKSCSMGTDFSDT